MKRWTLHSLRSNLRTARIAFTGQKPVETHLNNKGVKECRNFGIFSADFKSYRKKERPTYTKMFQQSKINICCG